MKKLQKEKLIKDIEDFERRKEQLQPRDAEACLMKILSPLLETEGYEVSYLNDTRDAGRDFLATDGRTKIGIEFKHYKSNVGAEQVRSMVGAAVLNGLDKAVIIASAGFSNLAKQIAEKVEPVSVELLDILDLKTWTAKLEADYDESEVILVLKTCTQKIIELISKSSSTLDEIEWRDLERVIAEIFEGIGFDVTLTPSSKDGGKDVILECISKGTKSTFIVEIKHWRSGKRVGEKSVREFVKVLAKEKRNGGLFLSTYGFTENAIESLTEIDKQKVRIGQETKIVTLCKTYLKRKSGLWHDENDLTEILFDQTS